MASDVPRSSLSGRAATLLSQLSAQGKAIFTRREAQEVTALNPRHLDNLLQHLVKQKWLARLSRGLYMILPLEAGPEGRYTEHEFVIATQLVNPAAIAYWSALNHHGFTEQIARTVFVMTTRRRFHSSQTILGIRYRFVTVDSARFFGLARIWLDGRPVQITNQEKTLVDALDRPELCGGISEVAQALALATERAEFNWETFTEYAERMSNRAILKRAGYLAELLQLPLASFFPGWQVQLSQGYARLDPTWRAQGRHDSRWRVVVNATEEDLLEWQRS